MLDKGSCRISDSLILALHAVTPVGNGVRICALKRTVEPVSCRIASPVESRPGDINYTSGRAQLVNHILPTITSARHRDRLVS